MKGGLLQLIIYMLSGSGIRLGFLKVHERWAVTTNNIYMLSGISITTIRLGFLKVHEMWAVTANNIYALWKWYKTGIFESP